MIDLERQRQRLRLIFTSEHFFIFVIRYVIFGQYAKTIEML